MSTSIIDGRKIEQRTPMSHGDFHDTTVYDQRYLPRWKTNKRAFYRMGALPVIIRTEVVDLNIEGCCLFVTDDVHTSQQLDIKVYLSDKVSFETAGIVVWKRSRSNGHFFAGVLFDKLPDATQEMILEYAFDNKGWVDFYPMT